MSAFPETSGVPRSRHRSRWNVSRPREDVRVKEWPVPKTVRDVRSFIGFANYYQRFIKNFASIAKPLHDLTKKSARFEWTPAQQASFDRLRLELVTAPVLQYPD